ncbi:MAG: PH domain-containing protein [Synergistaceae bacterium]|jgi:uncharacterized membrane protein YdbT with pleckstrin-like domain|nr:PH domain-containing protein [Synergistaceae bacterium]
MAEQGTKQVFKPAWRSFYWHILGMIAAFVIAVAISVKKPDWWEITWIAFAGVVVLLAADMVIRRLRVALSVSPDEVALEEGIISHHSIEISTRSIRTIQVRQNVIQRILNIGNIQIASSGTEEYEICISNLPSPHAIRDIMQRYERATDAVADKKAE